LLINKKVKGYYRVNLVTNPVIRHEGGKDWEMFTTSETYPWSFVTQIFHNGQIANINMSNKVHLLVLLGFVLLDLFVFCVMFCRSLFVLLNGFFWSLCCLFFFDFRIRITPVVFVIIISTFKSPTNCPPHIFLSCRPQGYTDQFNLSFRQQVFWSRHS
jgi:hypothetical protein